MRIVAGSLTDSSTGNGSSVEYSASSTGSEVDISSVASVAFFGSSISWYGCFTDCFVGHSENLTYTWSSLRIQFDAKIGMVVTDYVWSWCLRSLCEVCRQVAKLPSFPFVWIK